MTLALAFIFVCTLPLVGALAVYRMSLPEWRLRHGRVLSTLFDADGVTLNSLPPGVKCGACGRTGINTLVRNKGFEDLPVCQGCLETHHPVPAVTPDIRMRQPLRRLSLDEPDPPAKPMPRF